MGVSELVDIAVKAAARIRAEHGHICVVAQFDADGICAGSIMYRTLEILEKSFEINFVRQLELAAIKDIAKKRADLFVFCDMGSGQLDNLHRYLEGRHIVVIDHHQPLPIKWEQLWHVNPYLAGVRGDSEVSAAGLSYITARVLTPRAKELIYLALVGAAADQQMYDGRFKGVNALLLEDALAHRALNHERGLRLYGRYTRPLHKCLEYLDDPLIPLLSGSESGAVQFLGTLGIQLKRPNGQWRTLADLTKEEEKRLATALVLEGLAVGAENSGSLIGDIYNLKNNWEMREFATFLNACGRIERPLEGLKFCLGRQVAIDEIIGEYKKRVSKYLNWVRQNSARFPRSERAVFITAGGAVDSNVIGTIVGMTIRSVFKEHIVFGMANAENGIKISARAKKLLPGLNLGKAIKEAAEQMGGEGGGHFAAAGGKIPFGAESRFIEVIDKILVAQLQVQKTEVQTSAESGRATVHYV